MKVAVLLVCGLALASATASVEGGPSKSQKILHLVQLLYNQQQPNGIQKQLDLGNSFDLNNRNNFKNPIAIKQFQLAYQKGLLPRGENFNYHNPIHLRQAISLFNVFYFAKDYDTFFQAACWARERINEGIFAYALSVAIVKRPDTQDAVIHPQAEGYPFLYINTQAIQEAQYYKQQGLKQLLIESNLTNSYLQSQIRNQQQQQELLEGNENQFEKIFENQAVFNDDDQYHNQKNDEDSRLAYFTEDIDLNQLFAIRELYSPNWFNSQKYGDQNLGQNLVQNGENFYYYLDQLLTRYNAERFANNLPNVEPFQFNKNIQPGYDPQLQYQNGQAVPARPDNVDINNANPIWLEKLIALDRRLADAVDSQIVLNEDGGKTALLVENGIRQLGDLLQANEYSLNNKYYGVYNGLYGYFDFFRKVVASVVKTSQNQGPSALDTYSAALRDPVTYQIIARVVRHFKNLEDQLDSYTPSQVAFPGVEVTDVKVDKLITFFDYKKIDLFNAFNYPKGVVPQDYHYYAKQIRLNSQPFNYYITVNSEQEVDAVVRIYLGPMYDNEGNPWNYEEGRNNYYEIDTFYAHFVKGENKITRNSKDAAMFVDLGPDSTSLYVDGQKGTISYNRTIEDDQQYTLPQNLILPKGTPSGQPWIFTVSVHHRPEKQEGQNEGKLKNNRSRRFPFNRLVHPSRVKQARNIFFKTVTIFHKN